MRLKKLGLVYSRFHDRTEHILRSFMVPLPKNPQDAMNCAFIHSAGQVQLINRLLVLWGEYCRNIVIISAAGNALTIQGTSLVPSPGIRKTSDIKFALGARFDAGPGTKWDYPQWALAQAIVLKPSNLSQINLGFTGAPTEDLRVVRNFLVHPNKNTMFKYQYLTQAMGFRNAKPETLLASNQENGGTVLESWIADFQNAAYNAAL